MIFDPNRIFSVFLRYPDSIKFADIVFFIESAARAIFTFFLLEKTFLKRKKCFGPIPPLADRVLTPVKNFAHHLPVNCQVCSREICFHQGQAIG
jgi:hypothetical protein